MSTDVEWERWGQKDAYYGVLTHDKFRRANLTEQTRAEFLETGVNHAAFVMNICRQRLHASFAPSRVLDFGCGVGRMVIPFASHAQEAVGLDVSPSMLAEAQRNCDAKGVTNVRLLLSDDVLSALDGDFDLVHSCIVLQHIEPARGRSLFQRLVARIRPGGIGALHATYGLSNHPATFGQPPLPEPPPRPSLLRRATGLVPPPPVVTPPDERADPDMQMNLYNLNDLLFIVQQSGAERVHMELTDHGGALGTYLFFQKPS